MNTHAQVLICEAFIMKMRLLGFRIIACSVGKRHLHAVAEMMADYGDIEKAVGKCNQRSSYAVRDVLPGNLWAAGGKFLAVSDADHLRNAFDYVRFDQEPGAIVWSHRTDENWIADPTIGIIVMGPGKTHLRLHQAGV